MVSLLSFATQATCEISALSSARVVGYEVQLLDRVFVLNSPSPASCRIRLSLKIFFLYCLYNAHGHKLRFPTFEKAQFVTALGIVVAELLKYVSHFEGGGINDLPMYLQRKCIA